MRLGIDLGGTKIEGIVLDGSREIARRRVPTPRDDYDATIRAIAQVVSALEAETDFTATVGLGIPGAPDPDTGLVKNANSTWLIARPLQRDIEAALARPVRIANDANCFAVSEATDGAAANARVVFGVIIGTGVGGGIVINGQVLTGRHAIAGEWGHNPQPWPQPEEWPGMPCYCGRSGCIETMLSGPGMTRDHEGRCGEQVLPPDIERRAAAGDRGAEATLARYDDRMARALASMINLLDPDVIVLGGGMSNLARLYTNVPQLWARFVFGATRAPASPLEAASATVSSSHDSVTPTPAIAASGDARILKAAVHTRLVPAMHGDSSGVRGAAWLWPASGGRT